MATTTAAVTLTSDLLSDNMSVSTTTTCMKAGTTADGLDQMQMGYLELAIGAQKNLLDADNTLNVNKSNKVYICNESTDETYYITIMIDSQAIGRLYGGDWMFIPWVAEDATADLEIEALVGTAKIAYMWFHEGVSLPAVD
jgi:hypothetical protein